jgi:hypothetical protein
MPRRGSKQPYRPRVEYKYTIKDIAEITGMSRTALGVAKVRGKIDPGDLKSVVSFLTRRIIEKRLRGDLFAATAGTGKRVKRVKSGLQVLGKRTKKAAGRK